MLTTTVTPPPQPPFVPPDPFLPEPPSSEFVWYGSRHLWTDLPVDGAWGQLLEGEKTFWWNENYVWNHEPEPALAVNAQRLDDPAIWVEAGPATNAYHPSFQSAMLVGLQLPSPGCWEISGRYQGQTLAFVVWVPPEKTR